MDTYVPFPQWEQIGGVGSRLYEADGPDGRRWQLHWGEGWLLSPVDAPRDYTPIRLAGSLYAAMDAAGDHVRGVSEGDQA